MVTKMGKILCYIYDDMADFEISLLLHRLRNAGKREIVAISETLDELVAQSGLRYVADKRIEEVEAWDSLEDVEALVIPGGPINNNQNAICSLIRRMVQENKLVAAICFAPQFLGRAGILGEYAYTTSCSPEKIRQLGCNDPFDRANYAEKRCVTDRNVITAQGYAFVDFAEAVCDYLNVFENEKQKYEQLVRVKES